MILPSIFKICNLWEGLYYLWGCKRCILKFSSNRTSQSTVPDVERDSYSYCRGPIAQAVLSMNVAASCNGRRGELGAHDSSVGEPGYT